MQALKITDTRQHTYDELCMQVHLVPVLHRPPNKHPRKRKAKHVALGDRNGMYIDEQASTGKTAYIAVINPLDWVRIILADPILSRYLTPGV
jgi:hypothetical protein